MYVIFYGWRTEKGEIMMDPHHFAGLDWGEWVAILTLVAAIAAYARSGISRTARESSRQDFDRINETMNGVRETMAELIVTIKQLRSDMEERKQTESRMHQAIDDHERRLIRLETQQEEER